MSPTIRIVWTTTTCDKKPSEAGTVLTPIKTETTSPAQTEQLCHEVHTPTCRPVKAHSFPTFSLYVAYLQVTQKAMEKGCCTDVDTHIEKKSLLSIHRMMHLIDLSAGWSPNTTTHKEIEDHTFTNLLNLLFNSEAILLRSIKYICTFFHWIP